MKKKTHSAAFLLVLGTLALITALSGCKHSSENDPGVSSISFEIANMGNDKTVTADGTTVFTTTYNETFTVSTFKYYLSNVTLLNTDGSRYTVPNFYHLVDASKPATTKFTLSDIPVGTYSGMTFMVGVDSTATKADPLLLTGDLNPANNMYWAWNSGHIFLKLEGTVTSANNKALVAHIGGFRNPYPATYLSALPFSNLQVRSNHSPAVYLGANILAIFSGRNYFALSSFPTVMSPSATAMKVAYNYGIGTQGGGMFYVDHIQAN